MDTMTLDQMRAMLALHEKAEKAYTQYGLAQQAKQAHDKAAELRAKIEREEKK